MGEDGGAGKKAKAVFPAREPEELLAQDHCAGAATGQQPAARQDRLDGHPGQAARQRPVQIVGLAPGKVDEIGSRNRRSEAWVIGAGPVDNGHGFSRRSEPGEVIDPQERPIFDPLGALRAGRGGQAYHARRPREATDELTVQRLDGGKIFPAAHECKHSRRPSEVAQRAAASGGQAEAGMPAARCVPSHSGLISESPQLQSVTRLRVSKGCPSARTTGILPVTHSGPAMGPSDVTSVVTAICLGRSGSMSRSPSAVL